MKISIKGLAGVFLLISVLFTACDNSDELDFYKEVEQPTKVGVQETLIELNVQGDEVENPIAVLGPHEQWSLSASETWVNLSKGTTNVNGKPELTAVVSAEPNTGYSRTATATITATYAGESVSTSFEIVQETALEEPALSISETILNFAAEAETLEIVVETNQDEWTASTEADWLSLEQEGTILKISAAENALQEAREAEILLEAGLEPQTARVALLVNQAKPDSEESITINGIELILVKAGTYRQGAQADDPSAPNYYPDAAANQGPVRQVTISKDFYIGKYELTQAQFEDVMGYNPSTTKGANHPVEMVPWNTAQEFTEKLSAKTGSHFRLPTEAEWEYAARGGQKSNGFIYSGSNNPSDVAYHFETGGDQREKGVTVPVGTLAPNELGIHDMSGNVYEWVQDHLEPYSAGAVTDPVGVGDRRILRGGSWYHNRFSQASSYRGNNTDDFSRAYLGFRVIYIPEN